MPAIHRRLPRSITTLLIAAMLTAVSPWSWAQRDDSDPLARARQALRRAAPDDCAAPTAEDIAALRRAVLVFRAARDTSDEARALTTLGAIYDRTAQYRAAIPVLHRAARITADPRLRVQAQTILADALQSVSRSTEALDIVTSAINEAHGIGEATLEADALRVRAETNYAQKTGDPMRDLATGLNLTSETLGPRVRAEILNDQGAIESDSKRPEQASARFEEALRIEERIHDCRDEAQTLSNLGSLEEDRGEAGLALEAYNRALPLERQVGDRDSESKSLHALAKMHHDLGNLAEALSFYEQALAIEKQTGDVQAETATRVAIAGVYLSLHKAVQAQERYRAILRKERSADHPTTLNNLAMAEAELGNTTEARSLYRQAMRAAGTKDAITPAYSAWGIGELEQADALKSYFRALRMANQLDLPDLQGLVSASLMDHFRRRRMPDLAIFFGKQAVDDYQGLRANLKGMPDAIVSSFVHDKAQTYRTLARLLIDEGRLNEAQQVLDLLKIQQYADYMQWQGDVPSSTLARTSAEQHLEEEYRSKAAQITAAVKAADSARLTAADQEMTTFLNQLPLRLGSAQAGEVTARTDAQRALDAVLAEHPDTAIVYTLVNEDRYTAIVLTPKVRVPRPYSITQAALDAKCQDFLKILRRHRPHPETAAQELFRIIVAPIQRDLEDSGVKTIIWSLDGSLRFIPVSALMNPQSGRYLVQDYNIANYTPLGHFETDTPELAHATAIAMGVSRSYGTLPPLPNVPDELDQIVTDGKVRGSRGPLPGTILLDPGFTRAAMEREVRSQTVVHIASHFVLEPGNDSASYLLVGGSDSDPMVHQLSLADFKLDRNLKLQGTELVTLSACETGAENLRDDGVVMEGLSEAVLDKQAKAVISSLWQVNDPSTAAMMARFYQLWVGSGGKMTKSEALRRAQMELIEGHLQAPDATANRGLSTEQSGPGRFADPYYWAPFVLTGNWQ